MVVEYGYDLSCTYRTNVLEMPDGSTRAVTGVDLAIDMAEVEGRPCLGEALVRRLVTPRGTLLDVVVPSTTANYGTDVAQYINGDLSVREIAMAGASVDAEMRKDERVVRSATQVSFIGNLLMIPVDIVDGVGPFKLVLAVSDVTVQVLSAP